MQQALRGRVRRAPAPRRIATVCGVDVSVREGRARAALCVLSFPRLEPVEQVVAERPVDFPYVPGLLSFRELPVLVDAFAGLADPPDLLVVDGQGYAHPRRLGIAAHVGICFDLPTIGVGKTRLCGEHGEPGPAGGSRRRLVHEGERIGHVLRTREGVKPVYVSIGHRMDDLDAVRLVLRMTPRYRLPEPIRAADHLAGRW